MVPFGYVNRGLFEMKPQVKAMLDTIRSEAMYTASCTGRKYFKADVGNLIAVHFAVNKYIIHISLCYGVQLILRSFRQYLQV